MPSLSRQTRSCKSSVRPPARMASRKQTSTWVEDSSGVSRVVIHVRETMSMIAIAARLGQGKWVKAYPQTRFGFHSN